MKNKMFVVLFLLLIGCSEQVVVGVNESESFSANDSVVNESLVVSDESGVSNSDTDNSSIELVDVSVALSSGLPVVCEYVVDGQSQIIYLLNDNVRLDIDEVDSHGIFTKDMMYAWSGSEGSKVALSDVALLTDNQDVGPKSASEFLGSALNSSASCFVQDFSLDAFVVPVDVNFVDLSVALRELNK